MSRQPLVKTTASTTRQLLRPSASTDGRDRLMTRSIILSARFLERRKRLASQRLRLRPHRSSLPVQILRRRAAFGWPPPTETRLTRALKKMLCASSIDPRPSVEALDGEAASRLGKEGSGCLAPPPQDRNQRTATARLPASGARLSEPAGEKGREARQPLPSVQPRSAPPPLFYAKRLHGQSAPRVILPGRDARTGRVAL